MSNPDEWEMPPLPHRRARQGFLNIVPADDRPFTLRPVTLPDPATIPPREWIYGNKLIRGFVTLLVAPGGTGKSTLALAACIEIATAKKVLDIHVFDSCNVAFLNLEDPQDEMNRRLAALAIRYAITNDDLEGRLFMSPADRAVTIATMEADGFTVTTPDKDEIIRRVRAHNIGVLSVDPFAESHTLEENSNPQMVQAAAAWREVARLGNCAVLLNHHVRKGAVIDIESARGAKALTDSARVGILLSSMSPEEASTLGISAEDRLSYVRMDDAKMNLAPRAAKASWFHLDRVQLGNGRGKYPSGDSVAIIEPWTPTSPVTRISVKDCNDALDRIDQAWEQGQPYSAAKQSKDRWGGRVLMEMFEFNEAEAAAVIKTWLDNGVLTKETFKNKSRHQTSALKSNHANRPGTVRNS